MTSKTITLDLRIGGLGDNWMRLVGFNAAAALRPDLLIRLVIPANLVSVARLAFSDRLEILDDHQPRAITYAVRGLRDLLGSAIRGQQYASPYGRVVIHDWNRWTATDRLNSLAYTVCDTVRLVYSPPWSSLKHYQGYSEVVTIPAFRDIGVDEFNDHIVMDYPLLRDRLHSAPCSRGFQLPSDVGEKAVIFPSGTSHQFMPLEWAQEQMPDAIYAFFFRDPELARWTEAGLRTTPFYAEPGDMIALAKAARVAASTDSFPSHFLQSCAPRFVVMLTELPRHRVISPGFTGPVVPSLAPCYPCPHLERHSFPLCKAGHGACLNWHSAEYARSIKEALRSADTQSI